ncbi:MAG TPA: thrombospondin type 3 repeat-containing protein [bacterium]|jgi:hypothetical protein|nr:thrombospondin type 3 repeat-containing protein [bacterium]
MTDWSMFKQDELNNPNNISPHPFSASSNQQSSKKKIWLILLIAVILITVGGFFIYQAYAQSPERIIKKMFINLSKVKTWQYSGEIKTEGNLGQSLTNQANLSLMAPLNQDKKNSQTVVKFNGLMDIQKINDPQILLALEVKTDALTSANISFGLETRFINQIIYAKLSTVPYLGFFDLSSLKDQWLKVDVKTLQQQIQASKLKKEPDNNQANSQLSPEQISKLITAIQRANILTITDSKLLDAKTYKTSNGGKHYQYQFILNPEGIKLFLVELVKIVNNKELTSIEADKLYEKIYGQHELLAGKLLISQKDLLPRQISFDVITKTADKTKVLWKTSQTISFSDFNKPVSIDVPTTTKTLMELLSGFAQKLPAHQYNSSSTTTPTSIMPHIKHSLNDSDNDGLSDSDELNIYSTDFLNPDSDGDGYSDGDEVKGGYNPNGSGKLLIDDLTVDKSAPFLIK